MTIISGTAMILALLTVWINVRTARIQRRIQRRHDIVYGPESDKRLYDCPHCGERCWQDPKRECFYCFGKPKGESDEVRKVQEGK